MLFDNSFLHLCTNLWLEIPNALHSRHLPLFSKIDKSALYDSTNDCSRTLKRDPRLHLLTDF